MMNNHRPPAKVGWRLWCVTYVKVMPSLAAAALCLVVLTVLMANLSVVNVAAQERKATPTRAREVKIATSGTPVAEATITFNEALFNSFLDALFSNLKAPSFPLSLAKREAESVNPEVVSLRDSTMTSAQVSTETAAKAHAALKSSDECASAVTLEREMSGVKTAVHFENGRIVAPLAFTGSYNAGLLGCARFQGWADTELNLEFDRARQVLIARVKVRDIHLKNVPQLANNTVVTLVQDAIDRRVNPIEILQAAQLSARVPIAASGGALRLMAKEVRPEIVQGALHLHITYEFVPTN